MENPYQSPVEEPEEPAPYVARARVVERPTAVTVFGILNIVFGSFWMLCTPFSVLFLLMPTQALPNANPAFRILDDPRYREFALVQGITNIALSAVMLAAGVGLLMMKRWGRSLSFAYVTARFLEQIVGAVFTYVVLLGPMVDAAGAKDNLNRGAATVGGIIGGIGGVVINVMYSFMLLVFMLTPSVVAAFKKPGRGPAPGHGSADDPAIRFLDS